MININSNLMVYFDNCDLCSKPHRNCLSLYLQQQYYLICFLWSRNITWLHYMNSMISLYFNNGFPCLWQVLTRRRVYFSDKIFVQGFFVLRSYLFSLSKIIYKNRGSSFTVWPATCFGIRTSNFIQSWFIYLLWNRWRSKKTHIM